MAELTINTADIASALRKNLDDWKPGIEAAQVGRVTEVGDGIATVGGLPDAAVNELLEFESGVVGLALNLDEESIGAVVLGEAASVSEGETVKATGRILVGARRRRPARPRGRRPRQPGRRQGPAGRRAGPPHGDPGARHHGPQARARAAADRHQGHRRHDAGRPGPARADHRRPQDRQDHDRHRHDPQPAWPGREVHLRGDRPEGVDGGQHRRHPRRARRHGLHGRGRGRGVRPVAVQVPRPLRRLRHGPALDGDRRARPRGVRRPVQAGRGLPADLAAAAPPAGPRGLPRRRVLPAQPAARAGRQAVRRERRRLADRPAGHRDQGRRHLGLHPHQRDLDHRRPDLPAGRPVQVGCPAGVRHRPVGVPGGRCRPDQGHEEGRGHAQGRPVAVP